MNWRDAEYKGHAIRVGAHSATHHFVTHHSDELKPRGVIPDGLPFAIQTVPQDFMGKIAIDDSALKFVESAGNDMKQ
jgi:hypothetical protein